MKYKKTSILMSGLLCLAGAVQSAVAQETENPTPVEPTAVATQTESIEEVAAKQIEADESLHLIGERYDLSQKEMQEAVINNHFNWRYISEDSRKILREKLRKILSTPIGQEVIGALPADVKIPIILGSGATKDYAGLCTWRGGHNVSIALRDTNGNFGTFLHEISHAVTYCAGKMVNENLAYAIGDEVNKQIISGAPAGKKYHHMSEATMSIITNIQANMELFRKNAQERLQKRLQWQVQQEEKRKAQQTNAPSQVSQQHQQPSQPRQTTKKNHPFLSLFRGG